MGLRAHLFGIFFSVIHAVAYLLALWAAFPAESSAAAASPAQATKSRGASRAFVVACAGEAAADDGAARNADDDAAK